MSKQGQPHRKAPLGFTLIEVLISLFLLVVVSFATFQATTETFKLRDVLSTEGEFYNSVRLAMSVVQKDIENSYSSVVIRPEEEKKALATGDFQPPADAVPPQAGMGLIPGGPGMEITQSIFYHSDMDKFGIRAMKLSGTDSKLVLTSSANIRMYQDSPESDFLKVQYQLTDDADPESPSGSKLLLRTASTDSFVYNEDKDEKVKKYPLLHGIRSFKLRYYRKSKDQWVNSWDSESEDTREQFPDIIEVQLEVAGKKGLSFEGRYSIRPEVPLHGIPTTL